MRTPEEIARTAYNSFLEGDEIYDVILGAVNTAIIQEREACADIARGYAETDVHPDGNNIAMLIMERGEHGTGTS